MTQAALDVEQTKKELHAFALRLKAEQAKLAKLVRRLALHVEQPGQRERERCRRRDG
jgi:hypothetical protein